MKKQTPQQRQNIKRSGDPRLPTVYTTADILQKLDYLAGIHGSKKAAIEAAIIILHATEKTKECAMGGVEV